MALGPCELPLFGGLVVPEFPLVPWEGTGGAAPVANGRASVPIISLRFESWVLYFKEDYLPHPTFFPSGP